MSAGRVLGTCSWPRSSSPPALSRRPTTSSSRWPRRRTSRRASSRSCVQPPGRFVTVKNGSSCPNLAFSAPVSDPDVTDTLIYNFYVDADLNPSFVKQGIIGPDGQVVRSEPATYEVSFATANPLQQPGDHVVEVLGRRRRSSLGATPLPRQVHAARRGHRAGPHLCRHLRLDRDRDRRAVSMRPGALLPAVLLLAGCNLFVEPKPPARHLHQGSGLPSGAALLRRRLRHPPRRHARRDHHVGAGRRGRAWICRWPRPRPTSPLVLPDAAAPQPVAPARRWGRTRGACSCSPRGRARSSPASPGWPRPPVRGGLGRLQGRALHRAVHAGGQPARPGGSSRRCSTGVDIDAGVTPLTVDLLEAGRSCRRSPGPSSPVRASPSRRRRTSSSSPPDGRPLSARRTADARREPSSFGRRWRARWGRDPSGHPAAGVLGAVATLRRRRPRPLRSAVRGRRRAYRRSRSPGPLLGPEGTPVGGRDGVHPGHGPGRRLGQQRARPLRRTTAPSSWRRFPRRRPGRSSCGPSLRPARRRACSARPSTFRPARPVTGTWTCPPRPLLTGALFLPGRRPVRRRDPSCRPGGRGGPDAARSPRRRPGGHQRDRHVRHPARPRHLPARGAALHALLGGAALRAVAGGADLRPRAGERIPAGAHPGSHRPDAHRAGAPRCRHARLAGPGAPSTAR